MANSIDPKDAVRETEQNAAASELAGYLTSGHLALLLGAGVSHDIKLPEWIELVRACEDASGVERDVVGESSQDLMRRLDDVRAAAGDDLAFFQLIHDQLYSSILAEAEGVRGYPDTLLTSPMLIALGALVMSSVRGSVADVLTLNFDDVLEWYLHLHGFKTQVVESLPRLMGADVDVRIHHFHGYLPLMNSTRRSQWLVLTYQQLLDRISEDAGKPWQVLIASQLQTKVLLAVGTSMNDTDVDILLKRAHDIVGNGRPLGYVLGREISTSRKRSLRSLGMVPVSFEEYSDIPAFILRVCQLAASGNVETIELDRGL